MTDEIKKTRGPTCPQKPLEQAIGLAEKLFERAGRSRVKPIVMASALDYSSLNGAALATLAVLNQYGLLDKDGSDSMAVSDQPIKLFHPVDDNQKPNELQD